MVTKKRSKKKVSKSKNNFKNRNIIIGVTVLVVVFLLLVNFTGYSEEEGLSSTFEYYGLESLFFGFVEDEDDAAATCPNIDDECFEPFAQICVDGGCVPCSTNAQCESRFPPPADLTETDYNYCMPVEFFGETGNSCVECLTDTDCQDNTDGYIECCSDVTCRNDRYFCQIPEGIVDTEIDDGTVDDGMCNNDGTCDSNDGEDVFNCPADCPYCETGSYIQLVSEDTGLPGTHADIVVKKTPNVGCNDDFPFCHGDRFNDANNYCTVCGQNNLDMDNNDYHYDDGSFGQGDLVNSDWGCSETDPYCVADGMFSESFHCSPCQDTLNKFKIDEGCDSVNKFCVNVDGIYSCFPPCEAPNEAGITGTQYCSTLLSEFGFPVGECRVFLHSVTYDPVPRYEPLCGPTFNYPVFPFKTI